MAGGYHLPSESRARAGFVRDLESGDAGAVRTARKIFREVSLATPREVSFICPCGSHGYLLLGRTISPCGNCCQFSDPDEARLEFLLDLEKGYPYALKITLELISPA